MKERPILFSAPMVLAILGGTKTQTRRVISPRPHEDWKLKSCGILTCEAHKLNAQQVAVFDRLDGFTIPYKCPYGMPGDQLWVRETWQPNPEAGVAYPEGTIPSDAVCYSAELSESERRECGPWKPSIHMPRWASRIQLEITGIRVERLQDISEADAIAEGTSDHREMLIRLFDNKNITMKDAYRNLWESINGLGSWDENPWVWVVEFKRIKP